MVALQTTMVLKLVLTFVCVFLYLKKLPSVMLHPTLEDHNVNKPEFALHYDCSKQAKACLTYWFLRRFKRLCTLHVYQCKGFTPTQSWLYPIKG